ncbi:MAG: cytochrome c3 family protein [Pseudomonadota bacterium]
MAQDFHLKLITQRAGGGDPIVRERVAAGPEATIGRAADCDLVLPDLALDLVHARMRFTGPGRVAIESAGGLPFQVDGRPVQRADLDASTRPVIGFGEYRLAFEPGSDEGVVVTVTRDVDEDEHLSPAVFSLQARVINRRNMAWAFGGAIALLCLLVPLIWVLFFNEARIQPQEQWSSGPLTTAHAFMEGDCNACHQKAFVAVRDDACLACHQAGTEEGQKALAHAKEMGSPFAPRLVFEHAPHDKLEAATPLPPGLGAKISTLVQRAVGHPTDRCASCHIEHTPAKGGDPAAPLSDKPKLVVVNDCQSCHANLTARLSKTELPNVPDWGQHPKFRPLIMTQAGPTPKFQRVALSSNPQERNGLTFPHALHLAPLGGVARQAITLGKEAGYGSALECDSCHRPDASGKGFLPVEMERDCASCHSLAYAREGDELKLLPHGELQKVVDTLAGRTLSAPGGSDRRRPGGIAPTRFAATGASAYRATFSPGGACYDCHTINWAGDTVRMAPVSLATRYLPRGGFDHSIPEHGAIGKTGKAGSYECADCHKAQTSNRASDVLIPQVSECAACHGKSTEQVAAADDGDCTTCHGFHTPGAATPKPGHPPLKALRWTEVAAR